TPTPTPAPTPTPVPTPTPAPTPAPAPEAVEPAIYPEELTLAEEISEFTPEDLVQYNGLNGQPMYIAYEGVVYDVSYIESWVNGLYPELVRGSDITEIFNDLSYDIEILDHSIIRGTMEGHSFASADMVSLMNNISIPEDDSDDSSDEQTSGTPSVPVVDSSSSATVALPVQNHDDDDDEEHEDDEHDD
ncbi:MAG TPA: cytochrome b5 domain-containing protein, partial [Clostridia bacterium]|nr:cytochrome b5 domain-containing protein [Clostridia bacterium]